MTSQRQPDDTTLPDDFDWDDLPSQVTLDGGRTHTELPSVLYPWNPAPIRALHGFARDVIRERAELALIDPENEADAIRPMSSVRARWILLTLAEQDAERAAMTELRRATVIARGPRGKHESGWDLLLRLGAPVGSRWYGMIRCPAHDDRSASLSWRLVGSVGERQDEARALLHCFAGCTFAEILAATR